MRRMKRYFLLLLNVFLFVSVDYRQSFTMADLVEAAGEDAGKAVEDAAAKMADDLGITGAEDIGKLEDTLAKSLEEVPADALKNTKVLDDAIDTATEAATDSLNAMKESGENMADALDNFSSGSDAMEELSGKVQGSVKDSIESLAKSGEITETQAGEMLDDLKANQQAVDDLGGGSKEATGEAAPKEENSAAGENALVSQQGELADDFDMVDKPEGDEAEGDVKEKTKFEKVKDAFKKAGSGALHFIGEQAAMITFMTAPQMVQQAIEEELNRKAALRTVAQPIKFGNWVLQIPEPCIDEENPLQSVPLYVTVPVANIGDSISKATSAAFSNSIVGGTQGYGDVKIMGVAGSDAAQRYNTSDPAYYKYCKFVMSYPSQSYNHIGDNLISDPSFSGLLVDLNEGFAIDATGEQITAPPSPPLIPMKANGPQYQQAAVESIGEACAKTLFDKFQTAGLTATYSTFSGINSGASSSSLASYFDCSADGASKDAKAKTDGSSCIVAQGLDQYAKPVTFGSFGPIVPIYGWGTTGFDAIINATNFPHMPAMTVGDAISDGVLVTGSATGKSTTGKSTTGKSTAGSGSGQTVHFADAGVNYVAQGCWVYLCAQTPFAKAVQQGSALNSATGPYVDYVIFVDDQGNQVPLQVPVETIVDGTTDVSWPSIGFNPNAKFLISLVSANIAEFQNSGQVLGWESDAVTYGMLSTFSATVQSAISSLQTNFPGLYAQFEQHQKALTGLFNYGPFTYGKDKLEEASDYNLTDGNGTTQLYVYQGVNCFATSGTSAVKDLLIGLTSSGNASGLPNKAVTNFVSLVTDIKYSLATDGSLIANSDAAFHSAPGAWSGSKFTPDMTKKDSLAWLPYIYNAYTAPSAKGGAGLTISQSDYDHLTDYVQAQRDAWFNNFSDDDLVHGVMVGNLSFKLAPELDIQEAEANHLYIYSVVPSPSATLINKDWFVVVDNALPDLSTLSSDMVNVAASPSSAKALVSLVTGMAYDMTGAQLFQTSAGDVKTLTGLSDTVAGKHGVVLSTPASTDAQTIGQEVDKYLQTNFGPQKGLSLLFSKEFKAAIASYGLMENRPIPIGSLGGVSLGIYAGDLSLGSYVYFNTLGLQDPSAFEPKDLFVTVRKKSDNSLVFAELFVDATAGSDQDPTQFILSLISGQVYDKHGAKFSMAIADVSTYASTQSVFWRAYLKNILAKLQITYDKLKKAEAAEKTALDAQAASKSIDENIQWTQSDVLEIINRLEAAPLLPAPYAMLKQDPVTSEYVKLSPGSLSNSSDYMYTFFHVPYGKASAASASDAKTTYVGAMFTSAGELTQVLKGNLLTAIMHQYGLSGDATQLGAPMMQPSLLLNPDDAKISAGSSGSSMIVSSSPNFPGYDGAMANKALASGYSLYYSRNMNGYYALDSLNKQWIGLGAGHQYGLDGQPIPLKQMVAMNKKGGKKTFNFLLLEENQGGYMQGMMSDPSHGNDLTSWTNFGSGSWKNKHGEVPVKETKITKKSGSTIPVSFTVTFSKKQTITYTVDNSYEWQSIMYLPIDSGKVVTDKADMPAETTGRIVKQGNSIKYVVLGNAAYAANLLKNGDYTLVAMDDPKNLKTLTVAKDSNTNVPYVVISDSSESSATSGHKYGYLYNALSDDAFNAFLVNVVAGSASATATGAVTVCPISFPVGPMIASSNPNSSAQVPTSRTYTLYIPGMSNSDNMTKIYANKVNGAPDSTSSVYEAFSSKIAGRIYKSTNGRFFAQIYKNDSQSNHAPFFSYFNRSGFVDLQTAALFDSDGNAMGSSLTLDDWLLLLDTLQVTVNVDSSGKPALYYRGALAVDTQLAQAGDAPAVKTKTTSTAASAKATTAKARGASKR